jgi:hypothetical protein
MPTVGGQKFPYTVAGKKAAAKAAKAAKNGSAGNKTNVRRKTY